MQGSLVLVRHKILIKGTLSLSLEYIDRQKYYPHTYLVVLLVGLHSWYCGYKQAKMKG